jgi:NADH dehydrogenase [ubiquinone] 1 alpha subcomplex assembly factor 6
MLRLRGSVASLVCPRLLVTKRAIATLHKFDDYCFEQVKTQDYESYLSGLLVPAKFRGAFFALHAFNIEISTIKDQVPRNNVQAGRIRFQFWKDVLQQIHVNKKLSPIINQPVARALEHYILTNNLTMRWFERALETRYAVFSVGSVVLVLSFTVFIVCFLCIGARHQRFQDLTHAGDFETFDDLENYTEYSHSSLIYLLLETMGIKDENTEFIASHLGVCKGIVTLLRGYPHHVSQVLPVIHMDTYFFH